MLRFLAVLLCAQAAFGLPGSHTSWQGSSPQPIVAVEVPAGSQLPIFSINAPPQRVQEAIPQPIYTLHTSVRQPILGTQRVLEQRTLPIGALATQAITEMTLPQMVREVQGKNMPVLEGPAAQTLPVQELAKQHEQYPVKQQEQQKETVSQDVTQQVFSPHIQRIFRHAVPVRHINVNRYVQPIVNRVVQPVLETQVQEGKQEQARVAQKKHGHEAATGAPSLATGAAEMPAPAIPAPAAPSALVPEAPAATGAAELPSPSPTATTTSPAGFRMTSYRATEAESAELPAAVHEEPAASFTPAAVREAPAASFEEPAAIREAPVAAVELGTTGSQAILEY